MKHWNNKFFPKYCQAAENIVSNMYFFRKAPDVLE